ncbi:MAG: spermidine/putrescine ABC transporter substrate-binding protein [Actinomycetota bacterium]
MERPGKRRSCEREIDRRAFLRRSGSASLGLAAAATLLSACSSAEPRRSGPSFRLARPDRPVTLPLFDDNPPLDDDLPPEQGATLKIYNWEEYLWPKVANEFAEKYSIEVEISSFANMDEALSRLRSGRDDYDVFFHRVDVLGKLAAEKIVRPLNHSYIPNLDEYVWAVYRNPFYDQGWRYTVPYTVYTTGIAWRIDYVDEDVAAMPNPYEIYWEPKYKGKINLFDDYREVLGMALLKNGITNLNTARAKDIALAQKDLTELADLVGALSIDAYDNLPKGRAWIHQAYSGDMVAAQYYFPKGADPTVPRYWAPTDGRGAVGNDTIAVLKNGKNPVLAHHFLNYLLDSQTAMKNFGWNGYQPPQRDADPERLVGEGYVPSYLENTIVRTKDFNRGFMELELSPSVDELWHDAWEEFRTHV